VFYLILQLGLFILKDALKLDNIPAFATDMCVPSDFCFQSYFDKIEQFFAKHCDIYMSEELQRLDSSFQTHQMSLSTELRSENQNLSISAKKAFELLTAYDIDKLVFNLTQFMEELENMVSVIL
jgi:hypothetical protein